MKDIENVQVTGDGKNMAREENTDGIIAATAAYEARGTAGMDAGAGPNREKLSGLTAGEVAEKVARGLVNHTDITTGKTAGQIVSSNLFTYFNLIFLILAVLLCMVGSYRSLTFLPVVIGNTIIGIVQELRAKQILDKMNMLHAPSTVVVRDHVQSRIPSEELVQGDVILLSAGNQICADAKVLEGSIAVNESLLTGEADEIRKDAGSTLLSGSFVVAGQCYAQLEHVGEASYISRLTAQAKALGCGEQSEMVRSINQLVKWVGILIIPVGVVLFAQAYFVNGETIRTSIVSMIAAIIGMIPEGLYLLTTAALALSTIRLAGRKVLLHDMKSIEALARVDVLCVDKTGTITEPGMQVAGILPCIARGQDGEESCQGTRCLEEASLVSLLADYAAAIPDNNATMQAIREYIAGFSRENTNPANRDCGMQGGIESSQEKTGDTIQADVEESSQGKTGRTIQADVEEGSQESREAWVRHTPLATLPFSSSRKYSAVLFPEGKYVLGAPEFVMGEDYPSISGEVTPYLKKGYRVLVIGMCIADTAGSQKPEVTFDSCLTGSFPEDSLKEEDSLREEDFLGEEDSFGEEHPLGKVHPLGYLILTNPIRENAVETFSYFKEQGVTVKVLSGDNPETVSEVARRAGIEGAERFVDAGTLQSQEDLEEAAEQYTVFGRVTPRQKQVLVQALQKAGHTVAMTGDGVNDILAMKDADCSVAMASGSEAAAQAAQVVLLDSDFAHMPNVVWEGRRVVNNIQRSASLFLVKNIFSLLLALFSAVLAITYPLEPSQISLISMFTIGIPGFLLALEPNRNRIEGHFIRNVLLKAFPAGLTDVLAVAALVICGQAFALPKDDIATASTMLLAVVGFMILTKISFPFNRMKWGILVLNVSGLLFSGIFLGKLFAMSEMSEICILLMVVFAFAAESLFRYLSMAIEKISCGEWGRKLRKVVELVLCKMEA